MKLDKDVTYELARKLLQEKSPNPSILIEAKNTHFIETQDILLAKLFVTAQAKLRKYATKKKSLSKDVKGAIEEYLTALESFENGSLQKNANANNGIADLL